MSKKKAQKEKLKKLKHRRQTASSPEPPAAGGSGLSTPLLKELSPAWQQFYQAVTEEFRKNHLPV